MTTQDFKRRLTAILSADVQGYSILMRDDEEATIRTITTYRKVIANLIQQYRGRLVDATGDNLLSEFTSVVDAVNCAVEIQRELSERNAELPENRRMKFRIGINLGDVVQEGERIYGDGVNIAARMEGLAEGGGICISGTVYDAIESKIGLEYEYLGEQEFKNIPKPIRAYRVLSYPGAAAHRVIKAKKDIGKTWRNVVVALAAVLVVVAAVAVWNFYLRPSPPIEVASIEKMALPLPDKPSLAVLPFENLSGDPNQEYLADGISENIISAFSKISKIFVISLNSTFTYKGKPVKVQQVSRELGVRYVLEGSVQKAGNRLRVSAQLVDAITGNHIWSERYDRDLTNLFALQDDVTKKILTALQVKLTEGEQARIWAKGTKNLEAYLKFLQARENIYQMNIEANALARQLAEEAISIDPEYAEAYFSLSKTHVMDVLYGSSNSPQESKTLAINLAQKALTLDDSLADAHSLLGFLYTMIRKHDKGVAEAELATALDPNLADAHSRLGLVYRFSGRPGEAIPEIKKAIRLNPMAPGWYFYNLATAYAFAGQCDEAIATCKEALKRETDNLLTHVTTTVAYCLCGREPEARTSASGVLRINPNFSTKNFAKQLPYKNQADLDRYIDALYKAGLK